MNDRPEVEFGAAGGPLQERIISSRLECQTRPAIGGLKLPIAFPRPGGIMENCAWDVAPARERGNHGYRQSCRGTSLAFRGPGRGGARGTGAQFSQPDPWMILSMRARDSSFASIPGRRWREFEGAETNSLKGTTTLDAVLRSLMESAICGASATEELASRSGTPQAPASVHRGVPVWRRNHPSLRRPPVAGRCLTRLPLGR